MMSADTMDGTRSSQFNSTSLGTTPNESYMAGNGMAYVYTGPAYYVPSERRWMSVDDYRALPALTRKDAILFESEREWRKFQERIGSSTPSDVYYIPARYPTSHTTSLLSHQQTAWTRKWNGSGFFVPSENAWIREQVGPNIPSESVLFYNEENWMKYKFMAENQSLPDVKEGTMTI